jgi:L-ascorbate metabolism protein UlaG (beta-lactamase superfamily)
MRHARNFVRFALFCSAIVALHIDKGHAAPRFARIQRQTNSDIQLQLELPAGQHCRIECSSDLQQWTPLVTARSAAGMITHFDSAARLFNQRFYRATELSGTNIVTGDHLATSAGDVVIHPVNHASFVLSWNGKMIYNDPVGGGTPYQNLPKADLILVSHIHGDHYHSGTLDAVRGANVRIIAPQAVYNNMSAALKGVTTVLANSANATVIDLRVDAVPAYNTNHPLGAGNGYVMTIGDKQIYISGDTGDTPEMRALSNIDVAFLCMNVPFTMSVAQASSAVRAFKPRVVYPYHYRNQDNSLADLAAFRQQVGTDFPIEVRVRGWYDPPQAGQRLRRTRSR